MHEILQGMFYFVVAITPIFCLGPYIAVLLLPCRVRYSNDSAEKVTPAEKYEFALELPCQIDTDTRERLAGTRG